MRELVEKTAEKIVSSGLGRDGNFLVGGLAAEFSWSGRKDLVPAMEELATALDAGALVLLRPAEPYKTILDYYQDLGVDEIVPQDSETRTFLHSLPFLRNFEHRRAHDLLLKHKGLVAGDHGIIATGSINPSQGYVTASSICFAAFVKFFSDYLEQVRKGAVSKKFNTAFHRAVSFIRPYPNTPPKLAAGEFKDPAQVQAAMIEAGKWTVDLGLVDSCFGNVSCLHQGTLYISQTGSELDALAGEIDPCPLDSSSCAGLTASSELGAHMRIVKNTGAACVLHGHPRFTVIMSMFCEKQCENRGACHTRCTEKRSVAGVPIVPGEVGTGPRGLVNTLPPAFTHSQAAIVFGHGLFAIGEKDFNQAFAALLNTERRCLEKYLKLTS